MEKVLITGGSGYIALHCIVKFLKNGFSVRTSIRSTSREAEIRNAVDNELEKNLEFCQLDLNNDKGWDEAVKGCDRVIHMASPVVFKNLPDENSIIDPAKNRPLESIKTCCQIQSKTICHDLICCSCLF